jgi:hypothetical protein
MGAHLVVVTPPLLDAHLGFDAVSEPLQPKAAASRFIEGDINARLSGHSGEQCELGFILGPASLKRGLLRRLIVDARLCVVGFSRLSDG